MKWCLCAVVLWSSTAAGQAWGERDPITPAPPSWQFGQALAADGPRLAVAGWASSQNANAVVSLYERRSGVWVLTRRFTPPREVGESFGACISLSGGTLVVGAPNGEADGFRIGAVYVWREVEGEWVGPARVTGSGSSSSSRFGAAVAAGPGRIGVGSPGESLLGRAYVFEHDPGTGLWRETARITQSDGFAGRFGSAVDLDGEDLLVGDPGRNAGAGGATFYHRGADGVWQRGETLTESVTRGLGAAVSLRGGTAVLGAPAESGQGAIGGAVYIFERRDGVWTRAARILRDRQTTGEMFGAAVDTDGDLVVAGAPWDVRRAVRGGAVYVIERAEGVWRQTSVLAPESLRGTEMLGTSVALAGGSLVAGAPGADVDGPDAGRVLVFGGPAVCLADADHDGFVDFFDYAGFVGLFEAADPAADVNRDGFIDVFDYDAFVRAFEAGC